MIRHSQLGKVLTIAFAVSLLFCATFVQAQSKSRQIGTSLTATADPLVPRPHTKACVVNLFSGFQFAHFSDTFQNFQFTPAANCPGPWKEVVLDIDFSENAGRQFDRTAELYLGNTNLYFGTTPEPIRTAANHWHVERDITDYSALLTSSQSGFMELQNCTSDCGGQFSTLNGVFTVNAYLEFYPTPGGSPAPRVADMVLPLLQSNGSGTNFPAFLFTPTDQYATTFNLPQNIEEAYLDVISQSQSADEQWYACFPNDQLALAQFIYGCGNTDFRETEVTIDGNPVGIAPVSPWVYTGFLPDQWQPIPAAQTLDFVPYRVNLTPFASLLNDGNPHTISLSVFDDDSYFSSAASLLLYLDSGSSQVTGAVTQNTLAGPSPVVTENLQGTSTVTGTLDVNSARNFTIAGYVNTSHGQVATSISQQQSFASDQAIDFDTVNFTVLDQNTSLQNTVASWTTVHSNLGTTVTQDLFSFPITVDFVFPTNTRFGFTVATTQKYQSSKAVWQNGMLTDLTATTNSVQGSDVGPNSSSQHYTFFNLNGAPYDCTVTSANNLLTSISVGCNH